MDNKENNNVVDGVEQVTPVENLNPVEQVETQVAQPVQPVQEEQIPVVNQAQPETTTTNNAQPQVVKVEKQKIVEKPKTVEKVVEKQVPQQPAPQQPVQQVVNKETTVEKKPSKFKIFLLIVLFILLGCVIYFLPEISHYMRNRDNPENTKEEEITTGVMTCKYTKKGTDSTMEVESDFEYKENQLQKATTINIVTSEDKETLEKHSTRCNLLKEYTKDVDGTSVSCNIEGDSVTITQNISYATVDINKLNAAYTESGGTYPEFDFNEKIDTVKSTMIGSGYKCEKK